MNSCLAAERGATMQPPSRSSHFILFAEQPPGLSTRREVDCILWGTPGRAMSRLYGDAMHDYTPKHPEKPKLVDTLVFDLQLRAPVLPMVGETGRKEGQKENERARVREIETEAQREREREGGGERERPRRLRTRRLKTRKDSPSI